MDHFFQFSAAQIASSFLSAFCRTPTASSLLSVKSLPSLKIRNS